MVDVHTKDQRSYNMSRIKGKNTKPEIFLRKYLYSKGLKGYRINYKLQGNPDIVFPKYKLAIFVDGCFWHKCPTCYRRPETNPKFWQEKIERNVERDKSINLSLKEKGWTVIRIWEHDLRSDINKQYLRIKAVLKNLRNQYGN